MNYKTLTAAILSLLMAAPMPLRRVPGRRKLCLLLTPITVASLLMLTETWSASGIRMLCRTGPPSMKYGRARCPSGTHGRLQSTFRATSAVRFVDHPAGGSWEGRAAMAVSINST